ncbi:ATP-binding protein, partial [Salmonella enterica subsp. enterica serovar Anatum]|nr:ATP-binding protein [Salmonella enterica subsp. enterica serovar Anatum]
ALITDSLEWTDIDNCSLAPTRRTAGNLLQQLKESGADVRKIDEALLRQAFQPFMTTRKEGMGLGLAICQRLVRYGRGDISIRNQTAPDGLSGTVVTIHFLHENGGRDGDNSSTG